MKKLLCVLTFVLIFGFAQIFAENNCEKYINISGLDLESIDPFRPGLATKNQSAWWGKEGNKKYPKICMTSDPAQVQYFVVWVSNLKSETLVLPYAQSTHQSGTVWSSLGNWGTYSGTGTTYAAVPVNRKIWRVEVIVYQTALVDGQLKLSGPIFQSSHSGKMRWSKPDKDSLIDAIKFIEEKH